MGRPLPPPATSRPGHELAAILQDAVNRNHVALDLVLLLEHLFDVRGREPCALRNDAHHGRAAAVRERDGAALELRCEPGEVEPHLQIAQIARRKAFSPDALLEQLVITRPGVDLGVPVRLEETGEQLVPLSRRQALGWPPSELELAIRCAPSAVVRDLLEEHGCEVDRRVDLGVRLEQRSHPVVIAQRMQPNPGKAQDLPLVI